jgi:hypothetical protein
MDKCQYVKSTWKEGLRTGHIVDLDTCNGMNNKNVNETNKKKRKDDIKVRANEKKHLLWMKFAIDLVELHYKENIWCNKKFDRSSLHKAPLAWQKEKAKLHYKE